MAKTFEFYKDLNGNDRLRVVEFGVTLGELYFNDNIFFFTRPINDGQRFATHDIANNSSQPFKIGDKRYDRVLFIKYAVERGTLYEAGELRMVNNESAGPFQYSRSNSGDNTGISFNFTTSGNDIILTATITDATNAATIKVKTETISK